MSSNNSVLVFVCYRPLPSYGIWCVFKEIYLKFAARKTISFVLPVLLGLITLQAGMFINQGYDLVILHDSLFSVKFCSQVLYLYDSFIDKLVRLHKLWFVITSYCQSSVMSSCLLPLHSLLFRIKIMLLFLFFIARDSLQSPYNYEKDENLKVGVKRSTERNTSRQC